MRKIFLVFVFLFGGIAYGQVPCVAVIPGGAGAANGTSWTNALATLPAGTRGTRYYLADGTYSTTSFSTAASGTTIIEIRKAQSYDFGRASDGCSNDISAGFNAATMAAAQAVFNGPISTSTNYYVINGNGNTTAPGCGGAITGSQTVLASPPTPKDCGIKIIDSSGSPGGWSPGGAHDTVEYAEFLGSGVNQNMEIFAPGSSFMLLQHSYLHYSGCVYIQDVGSNSTADHNYFWGTEVNGGSACHGQADYVIGGENNGVRSNNAYRDITGTSIWTFGTSGTITGWIFYNNLIWFSTPNPSFGGLSDAALDCINGDLCTGFFYIHNTIVNCSKGSGGFGPECGVGFGDSASGGSVTIENNLYYANASGIALTKNGTTVVEDYNSFLNGSGFGTGAHDVTVASGSPNPLVNWPGGNFNLASDNANWNNFLSLGAPYTLDVNGNTFTSDRGAYQFVSAPTAPTLSPAVVNFNSINNGATGFATLTLSNVTAATISGITLAVSGSGLAYFNATSGGSSPCLASLAVSASCTIAAVFTPSVSGAQSANLTVNYSGGSVTSGLSGTGVAAEGLDDFGGRTDVSPSAAVPHAVPVTCSQSTTTQSCTITGATITANATSQQCSEVNTTIPSGQVLTLAGTWYVTVGSLNFCIGTQEPEILYGFPGSATALNWEFSPLTVNGASQVSSVNTVTGIITLTGFNSNTVASSAGFMRPGRWRIATVTTPYGTGPQYIDPENHWMYIQDVGSACVTNSACDVSNTTITNKYGNACIGAYDIFQDLVSAGYNAVGADSQGQYVANVGTCPANITNPGEGTTANASEYAGANVSGTITQPVKNINQGLAVSLTAGTISPQCYDYFDSRFSSFTGSFFYLGAERIRRASLQFINDLWDDTDFVCFADAADILPSVPRGSHMGAPVGFIIAVAAPHQTYSDRAYYQNSSSLPPPYIYSDSTVYTKTLSLSPPAACPDFVAQTSLTYPPCTWPDFVRFKYGTVAAMNTAWGSSYTTFGTSETVTSNETFGTGNGSLTSFSHTFSNVYVTPNSVQIYLKPSGGSAIQIGGDCPQFELSCVAAAGTGLLAGPIGWQSVTTSHSGQIIADANNNIEEVTTGGTTGLSAPAWPGTCTGSQATTDGTVSWTCIGPSLSYAATSATWASGTATITIGPNTLSSGNTVTVFGFINSGRANSAYNGTFTLTGETATTISYALATNPGAYAGTGLVSNGTITYATGVASLTFAAAVPTGEAVLISYTSKGWHTQADAGCSGCGTGLMDEDGSNTAVTGTQTTCLETLPTWTATHSYARFARIQDSTSGSWQMASTGGTSAGSLPSFTNTLGNTLIDGSVIWTSLGPPICGSGGDYAAPNANATWAVIADDMDAQFTGSYMMQMQNAYGLMFPDIPSYGVNTMGSYNTTPRPETMAAMNYYSDAEFASDTLMNNSLDPLSVLKYLYSTVYYTKPQTQERFPLSQQSQYPCSTIVGYCFATELAKGQGVYTSIKTQLGTLAVNGTLTIAGQEQWGTHPFQGLGFGERTVLDNQFNGVENVAASVSCSAPLSALTCGSETPSSGVWVGTNSLTCTHCIAAGNALWLSALGVSLSPSSLAFGPQALTTTSPSQQVNLYNVGGTTLSISGITITGTNSGDFAQTNNCGSSVLAGGSCSISATFTPSANGSRSASISIADSAAGSPQTVPMSGTGFTPTPTVSVSPSSLTFTTQTVGSPSNAQAIVVTNTGTATITFSSISLTGADAGDYGQTNTCGASLAVNASCSILVTFMPTTSGTRTASVSIADNVAGSPQTVALSGTGITGPLVAPDPGMFSMLQ